MSETTQQHYRTGMATLTATGFSTTVTVSVRWVRTHHTVTLYFPAFTATSNAVTFTLTGLPAELAPSQALTAHQVVVDNGANAQGIMILSTATPTVITLGEGGFVAGGFTATGNKGLPGNALTYLSIPPLA